MSHPPIASQEEWLAARTGLLAKEKALTRQRDAISAERRRLPMVKITKDYVFTGPGGPASLLDLFGDKRQLIVYHFMFDPEWDAGCPGCTGLVNAMGDLSMLTERDTRLVLISRAPLAKLEAYKAQKGWTLPWYSSYGSDFNYDFHVTHDARVAPVEYNFKEAPAPESGSGEAPGTSVLFRIDDAVFHTYSTYARGSESLTDSYSLLDITPYGRQEDWEDSPPGWPQRPTYG
jgi:predicted dithiol-disulfide oxidoreductase (DUF899 family)